MPIRTIDAENRGVTDLGALIHGFFAQLRQHSVEVYNEPSLQLELGIFLRCAAPGRKVQFERAVSFFNLPTQRFVKREIDIVVFQSTQGETQAIELKCPSNGQYPEQMYKACEDVLFLEQLVAAGFGRSYFVMLAEDPLFFEGPTTTGIYSYFRGNAPIHGKIHKPTGQSDQCLEIAGSYPVQWMVITRGVKYALVEVDRRAVPNEGMHPTAQKAGGG